MQRELHPTLLSSLEGIVDQMVWFRENWHEEVRKTRVQFVCVCQTVCRFLCFGADEKVGKIKASQLWFSCMCESTL